MGEGDLSTVWTVYAKYFHAVYTFIAKYLRGRQGWGTEGGAKRTKDADERTAEWTCVSYVHAAAAWGA